MTEAPSRRYIPFYEWLYHGTTMARAKIILNSGFDLTLSGIKAGSPQSGVSTSLDRKTAREHAEWAVKKFGGKPAILAIDPSNLNILPGRRFIALGDHLEALTRIERSKRYDAVEFFDVKTGDGIEEMEVVIFDPKKIRAHLSS